MSLKTFKKLLVGLSFLASASAFAAPVSITVDLFDIPSYGGLGDPDNFVGTVDVGANSTITSIAFDLTLTALDPSYLSEMVVAFESTDFANGVFFTPGLGDEFPGSASYSGFADLVDLGLSFQVGTDGLLRVEFFEDWDDYFFGTDGFWNGSFTFGVDTIDAPSPVPEPASALLLAAGLATMRYAGRRGARKSAATTMR
ncbi:PEP-CTERM sorting domain-containing protein [Telluria beijingensis]|uniref:PEP-CTERM sorting domain-containing protein n=1 Tax=Telluria beijingensis TaxID=3068633 RepID=UPI0027956C00|nr:PEP-CTERM sorting domain-containing protein [Massilia sp. REN29]